MSNPFHMSIVKKGAREWNVWRTKNPDVEPDLCAANFSKAVLRYYDFKGCNLSSANFIGADIRHAGLGGVNLDSAVLRDANLYGVRLTSGLRVSNKEDLSSDPLGAMNMLLDDVVKSQGGRYKIIENSGDFGKNSLPSRFIVQTQTLNYASLRNACLDGADLREAIIANVFLDEVSLTDAKFGGTSIDANLAKTNGLENIQHSYRSFLSLRSIKTLPYPLPENFLRGCGLSDFEIEIAKLYRKNISIKDITDIVYRITELRGTIQFYSCFISYSSNDQTFAEKLHTDLQNSGVRCWFAPKNIKSGQKIHYQIDNAVKFHDKLLLILSPHSLKSEWVKTEIRSARKRERKERRQMLFPLRLVSFEELTDWELFDADEGRDLASEVREYFIPDFTAWRDNEKYQESFKRLLKDLQV